MSVDALRLSRIAYPLLPVPRRWARLLLVMALLATSWATTTAASIPGAQDLSDKLLHALAFGALMTLGHAAFPGVRGVLLMLPLLSLYGFAIELVQARLPYRSFELLDWVADMAGLLGYLILAWGSASIRRALR